MINKCFLRYKEITKEIIVGINNDKDVTKLMNERQTIIEEIATIDLSGEEKEKYYIDLEIDKEDALLEKCIKKNLEEIKDKIKKAKAGKQAFKSYSSVNRQVNLFSRDV